MLPGFMGLSTPYLQLIITVSLIYTHYNSLRHALCIFSLLCFRYALPGNGCQHCRFLGFRVHGLLSSLAGDTLASRLLTTLQNSLKAPIVSPYNLCTDPTENTCSSGFSVACHLLQRSCDGCCGNVFLGRLFWICCPGFQQTCHSI